MTPHKTKHEIALNTFYMNLFKTFDIIPKHYIEMFERDKSKIRKTNKIYKSCLK